MSKIRMLHIRYVEDFSIVKLDKKNLRTNFSFLNKKECRLAHSTS